MVTRVVFAVLVVATAGAFLAAQLLKNEEPLVIRFDRSPRAFSPNGDGIKDGARVGFVLSVPAEVSFSVIDSEGKEVRRLVDDRRLPGDERLRFGWDGRDDDGDRVPDGVYRLRVLRRDQGRSVSSGRRLRVDTRPPRMAITSARPGIVRSGSPSPVRVDFRGLRTDDAELTVWRTDDTERPREIARFRADGRRTGEWDARVGAAPAPEGSYAFSVAARDRGGNLGRSPSPPTPESAVPGSGVVVRGPTLSGPLEAVPAGSAVRLRLEGGPRRAPFALRRLDTGRPLRRGVARGPELRIELPDDARSGLYVLRVEAGGKRLAWPIGVAGQPAGRSSPGRPRPLVVLPALTWQGRNRYDGDLDGFPESLDDAPRVALDRPFAGGGLPAPLRDEAQPLLDFLDRARLPYDLTTDLSLARGDGPSPGNSASVVTAGGLRWAPPGLRRRLADYVEGGGRVATIGAESLRREVTLERDAMRDPGGRRATDAFGERTELSRTGPAPMSVQKEGEGVFRGVDPLFGSFTTFERSLALPAGARTLASAGREADATFVVYRAGRGLVVRVGSPGWGDQLREATGSPEVERITRNLWRLLGG